MQKTNYVLRISTTSRCNLKCKYCSPSKSRNEISTHDIIGIIKAAAKCGINKISWTGGEPTVRKDILTLISSAKNIGITEQTLTTNGILLCNNYEKFKQAGINKVNISLDTLQEQKYKDITGKNALNTVIKAVEQSINVFDQVKINCLVIKDNFDEICGFVNFAQMFNRNLVIRFLELVPCDNIYQDNEILFLEQFISASQIIEVLKYYGELSHYPLKGNVPKSKYFKIEGKKGIFGVNPNFSVGYKCDKQECPKIRLNPNGYISNCTTNLQYCKYIAKMSQVQKDSILLELIEQKKNRNYSGFIHKQKYYDFWRFGISPKEI